MRWLLATVVCLLSGCAAGQAPLTNPFLGPTTVPPPSTGAGGTVAPAAPYYQPNTAPTQAPAYQAPQAPTYRAPQAPASRAPAYQPPARPVPAAPPYGAAPTSRVKVVTRDREVAANQATAGRFSNNRLRHVSVSDERTVPEPSNVFEDARATEPVLAASHDSRHDDSRVVRAVARDASENPPSKVLPAGQQAVHETVIRIVEPKADTVGPHDDELARSGGEPRNFVASGPIRDLKSLPPARRRVNRVTTDRGRVSQAAVRSRAAMDRSGGRYSYDPSYRTLRGKLEYSAVRHRWKLRYIPIDSSETDEFGGSVELATGSDLQSFKPGQFVVIEGTLGQESGLAHDFAPRYRIDSIQAL